MDSRAKTKLRTTTCDTLRSSPRSRTGYEAIIRQDERFAIWRRVSSPQHHTAVVGEPKWIDGEWRRSLLDSEVCRLSTIRDVGKVWAKPPAKPAILRKGEINGCSTGYFAEPPVGFEPTTPALQERCSGQLS